MARHLQVMKKEELERSKAREKSEQDCKCYPSIPWSQEWVISNMLDHLWQMWWQSLQRHSFYSIRKTHSSLIQTPFCQDLTPNINLSCCGSHLLNRTMNAENRVLTEGFHILQVCCHYLTFIMRWSAQNQFLLIALQCVLTKAKQSKKIVTWLANFLYLIALTVKFVLV